MTLMSDKGERDMIYDNNPWKIDENWLKDQFTVAPERPSWEIVKYKDKPLPKVKKVIFNPPATIIIWNDNTKSVVQCQNGEPFDAEKGFALAYLKKLLGNDNTFNKEINKWVNDDLANIKKLYIKAPKTKEITFTLTADQIKFDDFI